MGRRGTRALLGIVVLAGLAGIGWKTWRSVQRSRFRQVASAVRELVPDVTQQIRDFRRVKVKDGRLVWSVEAKEARYFEDEDRVRVLAPHVVVYFDDGARRAELSGREGRLDLTNKDLDVLRLDGDVRLHLDDFDLATDHATYERSRDLVVAPGPVTIRGRTLDVAATGMEVELGTRRLRLLADVHTELKVDGAQS
jgi:LPS export ABC transporter protein LptC